MGVCVKCGVRFSGPCSVCYECRNDAEVERQLKLTGDPARLSSEETRKQVEEMKNKMKNWWG